MTKPIEEYRQLSSGRAGFASVIECNGRAVLLLAEGAETHAAAAAQRFNAQANRAR